MKSKLFSFMCVIGALAFLLVSCEDNPEGNRAVVTVASFNDNAPFFCDVLEQGDSLFDQAGNAVLRDDFIAEDYLKVAFYNRPYNSFIVSPPGYPYGEYLITRYRVEWARVDGGVQVPPPYDGATSISIPSGELVEGYILLVPFMVKELPFIWTLRYVQAGGTGGEILCVANITFWGHEVGTDRETEVIGSLSVNFADWVIETKKKKQL
ncbi:MAG: hypothetical protein GTO51_03665 [Candidatus Latescibacteria bacterium]|nr:hypothetical protein [Candidatus Latescibacterota bacterium]NIM20937.1 hypothetical protein [Candidatus Latescibacterota bacterium]NIM65072.1 hypothetical protein [Candidatus Latescibacterota bacterium]NIO01587.1 hypothetical protein [Candidatus Latescibacterota bacterium]NIO28104.1 hypothetical protein [Candidatus Latescibacterota bacterium]